MRQLAFLLAPLLLGAAAPGDERAMMVTGFDRLRIDGPFTVYVVSGPPGVTVSGDRAALDQVAVRVDAGTLIVNSGLSSWESAAGKAAGKARIRVSVPALRVVQTNGGTRLHIATLSGQRIDLSQNGDGRIEVDRVAAQDLAVTLAGAGSTALAGNAMRLRVRLYGASSLDAAGLTSGDAVLVSGSSGELAVGVRFNARISAVSSGTVRVLGNPRCAVTGSGPVECAHIEGREAD